MYVLRTMEFNSFFFFFSFSFSVFLFHSIPVSLSRPFVTSTTPPVLVPRLETWVRSMHLSFRPISEPPLQSQFPSHSSTLMQQQASVPTLHDDDHHHHPFLDGNSEVLGTTMKSIARLIKLASTQTQRLSTSNTVGHEPRVLEICKHRYNNASASLQQAMDALLSNNAERMNTMLKAVLSDVGECRHEYSGKPSPLANYDDTVTKMTTNCLLVLRLASDS